MNFSAMKLSRLAMSLAGAMSLVSAIPANAATFVFDFGANNGLNTVANPDTYSLTVNGLTVNVRAFSNVFGSVNFASPTNVTWTGTGLGANGNDSGEIDHGFLTGAGEGLLLTFAHDVELTQALFGDFGGYDDVHFEWGSPLAPGETLDSLPVTGSAWNGSFTGSQFFFAAKEDYPFEVDSFRLDGVTVKYTTPGGGAAATPLPEPATWAMMILGFGAIGGTMRRRQRPAVQYDFA